MTDAEFLRFIRNGGSEIAAIAEIEFAYESGGSLATGTLRFSDTCEPVSGSTPYQDGMQRAPELERAIDLERLGGRGSRTVGSIVLDNSNGEFDYLLDVIIDGRDAVIAFGGKGWARADFRTLAVGAVSSVRASSDKEITVELRDKNYLLDDTIIGDALVVGPNAGKPKPILLGYVYNHDVTPYLFDSSALKYCINNFALAAGIITAPVRDAGVSLNSGQLFLVDVTAGDMTVNTGTDTLTYTVGPHGLAVNDVVFFDAFLGGSTLPGLTAETQYWVISVNTPNPGDFQVSTTKGGGAFNLTGSLTGKWWLNRQRFYIDPSVPSIELSAPPEGRVTIDTYGTDLGGFGFPAPHTIFEYLLVNYTKASSIYDAASVATLEAAEVSESIGAGLAVLDRVNVLDLLDSIAISTRSWYGWGADGILYVGRLDLANLDAATPDDTINTGDIIGDLSAENLTLPSGKMVMDTNRNVVTQTDGLLASVSAEDKSTWAQQYQNRVTTTDPGTSGYLANWWDYHQSSIDSAPVASCLHVFPLSNAQDAVDAMTDEFKPWTRVHRCTVGLDKYALNPGDCVTVTYPRYGLSAGKNCRVISVKPRVSDREVDLVLVRKAPPDYTTGVH